MRCLTTLLLLATPLGAQAPAIAPARSVLFASVVDRVASATPASTAVGASRSGGRSGAAIGTALGTIAAFAAWNSHGSVCADAPPSACGWDSPEPIYFIAFPMAGAGLGYLVGRSAGEHFPGPTADSEDRGLNWWQGGLIGSAVGSFVGVLLADRLGSSPTCSDCTSTTKGEFQAAGAGGAMIGFLIGARVASVR